MGTQAIEDGKIRVGDVELEVFRRGSGPPLLLLHGGDGLDHRARFMELLARRFEVIAPSHPGFGRSPLPDRFDSVDDLAYLYLDLIDALDLHDVVLVGFSLGGWIAAEVAVRCCHRIGRLVLVAPVGIKLGGRETRDLPDIFATNPDELARLAFHDPSKAAVDYAALSDDELRIIARNRESLALYTWEPYMHNPKLRYRLGRIRVPTLVIRGASDRIVSAAYADGYSALISDAKTSTIDAAGHSPQIEQPEELANRIIAFTIG